ncbi:MAG: cell division protein FtsX, partial [Methylophilaceae bacterium]
MKLWLAQHLQALLLVLNRFSKNTLSTLLIALAIGVTLALPVLLYTVLDNLNGLVDHVKKESHISVFLAQKHDEVSTENIKKTLSNHTAIKRFQYVPKEEALNQLAEAAANQELLAMLEENPLPDAFFIEPTS